MNYIKHIFLLLIFAIASASKVQAHPLDLGVLNLIGDNDQIHARLEINPAMGARVLKIETQQMSADILQKRSLEFFESTIGASNLSIGNVNCTWDRHPIVEIENPQLLSLDVDAYCPKSQGDLTLDLPFLKNFESSYRLLSMVRINHIEHVTGADPVHSKLQISFEQPAYTTSHFIGMGLEHIGVARNQWKSDTGYQFPGGIDHILFVLALLLTGGTLIGFLKTITGFTVGHTVSLALVSFGLVHISSRWVEPAIALTIAFVALQAITGRTFRHRIGMTFAMGLIHGLGFATALSGLGLDKSELVKAVLGFNVGVELGQAAIIFIFTPFLIYIAKFPKAKIQFTKMCGSIIFVISMYWFMKRAFYI